MVCRIKSGNDGVKNYSRDAICIRVFVHAVRNVASDGREAFKLPSNEGRRSAERRTSGTRIAKRCGRGHLRPLAFRRSSAAMRRDYSSQLGLGRASWNRRMQTGGPSPTPVQQAPCSPITRRTGRCPDRLKAEVTSSCNSGTAPAPSVRVTGDVPHEKRDCPGYHYR